MSAHAITTPYKLTEDELEELSVESLYPNPVIRAAANTDARVLEAILALKNPKFVPSAFDGRQSALNTAIALGLTKNVALLLSVGADPNGLPREAMSQWSARFLRFVPYVPISSSKIREELEDRIGISQFSPLSDEEITGRRKSRMPFWGGPAPANLRSRLVTPASTAIEAAVLSGNIDTIDAVLNAGADTDAWTDRHEKMPGHPTVSFLSPTTPLHSAVSKGNVQVVRHLLGKAFRVDTFPFAATTRCLNPLMFSIAQAHRDLEIYDLLAASPTADYTLVTPIFQVHISHVACATLSVAALERLEKHLKLEQVQPTALGHTLLHIACLPQEDGSINHFSPKIHESIHELRMLNPEYGPKILWPFKPPGQFRSGDPPFSESPPDDLERQLAVIEFLQSRGISNWETKDIHGNNPLHYLVSQRRTGGMRVTEKLRTLGTDDAWSSQNIWGHTPKDLLEDGDNALRQLQSTGQTPGTVINMPHWRDPMGCWVGGQWKSKYPEDQ